MKTIKVNNDWSVPLSEESKIEGLKQYRAGNGFIEYTTGTRDYAEEHLQGEEKNRQIFRVVFPTWLERKKINRVN